MAPLVTAFVRATTLWCQEMLEVPTTIQCHGTPALRLAACGPRSLGGIQSKKSNQFNCLEIFLFSLVSSMMMSSMTMITTLQWVSFHKLLLVYAWHTLPACSRSGLSPLAMARKFSWDELSSCEFVDTWAVRRMSCKDDSLFVHCFEYSISFFPNSFAAWTHPSLAVLPTCLVPQVSTLSAINESSRRAVRCKQQTSANKNMSKVS